jgi:SAM-dependent methyltransferase
MDTVRRSEMRNADNLCPLCNNSDVLHYHRDKMRSYLQCSRCRLVFVPPHERLSRAEEKARYDLHINDPYDHGYRSFLSSLAEPLLARVPVGSEGLDFGCGPGPALPVMLLEQGRPMTVYDPFYAPDDSVWLRTYYFITATEVLEHLYRPREELDRLFRVLRPGGWLGIMTKLLPAHALFHNWDYMRDSTHVCFFSLATFEYIAAYWHASLELPGGDVVLFQKRACSVLTDL